MMANFIVRFKKELQELYNLNDLTEFSPMVNSIYKTKL